MYKGITPIISLTDLFASGLVFTKDIWRAAALFFSAPARMICTKLKAYGQVISHKLSGQMFRRTGIVIILLIIFGTVDLTVEAQQPIHWSPYERIPDYDDDTLPPYMIADQNRTVHAFTSQWVGDNDRQLAIVYRQWTLADGWTDPVDILLSPSGQARIYGAYLDQTGMIHVVFFGGDDRYANIYYSRAPAANAGNAQAWSVPEPVGWNAITPSLAALAGDDKGNLVIVYSGNIDTIGLYATYSADWGNTWSDPTPIFLTYSDELFPFTLSVYMNPSSQLHAVWNVNNRKGQSEAGYYAKLDVNQRQWSEPVKLDDDEQGGAYVMANPTVIEAGEDQVLVMYHHHIPNNVVFWARQSSDGGQTWTPRLRPFPNHIGANGPGSLISDSNGAVHALFGQRINDLNHGMWHSVWQDNHWSRVEAVVSGPSAKGFDPSDARAVISQGNVLLVTWRTDPGNDYNGVWYSYAVLDTPELPVVPLPTVPASSTTPTAAPTPTAMPTAPTPTALPRSTFTDQEISSSGINNNPMESVILGIIPVALLISIIIGVRQYYYRRH